MKPNFKSRTAKIIVEVRNRTCIDEDVEILKEILQDELKTYYAELEEYYEKEYCNVISSTHSRAYDAGYDNGYADGYSASHSAVQDTNLRWWLSSIV